MTICRGDNLSPIVFNVVVNEGPGYRMFNKSLEILCYALDATLIAEDEHDAASIVQILKRLQKGATKLYL